MKLDKQIIAMLTVTGIALLAVTSGIYFWHGNVDARLDKALKQYAEHRNLLVQYDSIKRYKKNAPKAPAQNLFAAISEKSRELGIERCIDNLKPGGSQEKGIETIDLQLRGLYLTECMKMIEAIEMLDGANLSSISLVRNDKRLLDINMRIIRLQDRS